MRREAVAYTHNDDHRSHPEVLLTIAYLIAYAIQTYAFYRPNWRWLATGLLAAIGGYLASEYLVTVSIWR